MGVQAPEEDKIQQLSIVVERRKPDVQLFYKLPGQCFDFRLCPLNIVQVLLTVGLCKFLKGGRWNKNLDLGQNILDTDICSSFDEVSNADRDQWDELAPCLSIVI